MGATVPRIAGTECSPGCPNLMRRVAILALFLVARTAYADTTDTDTDTTDVDGSPRTATPYWLHGKLDGITAKLGLRYHLDVVGPNRANQFDIMLPTGGVATAATLTVDGVKHRLALDAADHATEVFGALTDVAAGPHRHWAAQITKGMMTDLSVTIASPHSATLTLDLEVDVPTCFKNDRRLISVQAGWRGSIDRSLKIAVIGTPEAPVTSPCLAKLPTAFDDDDDRSMIWIELPTSEVLSQPFGERRIATIGHRIDVEHGHFARVEIDLASQISQIPPDLMTVFVIDASRSMADGELEAQAKIIESYTRLAPQSQIQIVAYSRKARPLLPGWMVASYAQPRLERELATLATNNGSNVDAGLVEANAWLEHANGTRRVIMFTDELLGDRVAGIEPKALRDALPANTLVHVIALDHGSASVKSLVRDDEIVLGHVAIDSEGLAMRAMGDDNGQFNALELLRPLALERVKLHDDGWTEMAVESNASSCSVDGTNDLVEGDTCVFWGDTKNGATTMKLEGLLWNHKFSRVIKPAGEPRMLARILTGFAASLGDAEAEIELAAHAVNAQWSMIATWGGVDGYADQSATEIYGGFGCGCGGSSDIGGIGGGGTLSMQRMGSISDQITRATNACHVKTKVTISLELTLDEIVDVDVATEDAADLACVTEAVWATPLALMKPADHDTAKVVLVP
jgi:von Willebrand factor type A domain